MLKRILIWSASIIVLVIIIAFFGFNRIQKQADVRLTNEFEIEIDALELPIDSTSLAWGRHVSITRGCTECHGADLGGKVVLDDPAMGMVYAANLTEGEGGLPSGFEIEDWLRAIRHGVRWDGTPIPIMPSWDYWSMSDHDITSLIAFMQQLEPVDRAPIETELGPIAKMLIATDQAPLLHAEVIEHGAERPVPSVYAETIEHGEYLTVLCMGCHNHDLNGGKVVGGDPSWPPASNLTPDDATGLGLWTRDDFFTAMRTGKSKSGKDLDVSMPWVQFGQMTDIELGAIWMYLETVKAKPVGK